MLKKIALSLTGILCLCVTNVSLAESGSLFSIHEDCIIAPPYSVSICLDGQGPMTCEIYNTKAIYLRIKTTVPHQQYANVGIKVLSPLFTPTNCTPSSNGYCLFPANDTIPITITMNSLMGEGLLSVC